MEHDAIFHFAQLSFRTQQLFHRGYGFAFAGNNEIKVTEICINVERKTVGCYPACDVNTDGGNFSARGVNAGQTVDTKRLNAKVAHCADQYFLEIAHVMMNVFTIGTQFDDGIADKLAQTVVGYFAAAISFKDRHVSFLQLLGIGQDGRSLTAPADCQRMWMFEQQKRVRLVTQFDGLFRLFLNCQAGLIIDEAEPLDQQLSFPGHATTLYSFCVILQSLIPGTLKRRNMLKRIAIASLVVTLIVPAAALGQTRSRTSRSKPAAKATPAPASTARTAGATRVADQIKLMTRFIYLLGGVTSGIAQVDEAVRRNEASPQLVQSNQQSKERVKASIQDFKVGLDKLETDFRATPELQPYYIKLAGSAAGAATAEEQAASNQFDAAGRSLLNVINRLTDVLLGMRQ